MPKTVVNKKTWRCSSCGYAQDFEPTAELLAIHFKGQRLPAGVCPACFMGKNPARTKGVVPLPRETRPELKIKMTVMGEEDIETEVEEEDKVRQTKGLAPLSLAERDAYRTKRRADITGAIARAKLLEDV